MGLLNNILAHNIKKIGEGIPQVVMPKMGVTPQLTDESMVYRVRFPTCTFNADTF